MPPFAPGAHPPSASANPQPTPAAPMPAWGVALLIGAIAIGGFGGLGFFFSLRQQGAARRKPLWPGLDSPPGSGVGGGCGGASGGTSSTLSKARTPSSALGEARPPSRPTSRPSSYRANSFRRLDDDEDGTELGGMAGLADAPRSPYRANSVEDEVHSGTGVHVGAQL